VRENWTWEEMEAFNDFMDSWANAFLCDQQEQEDE
jgi:hypothetical protein